MFIAMNRFTTAAGQEAGFEKMWRERESHLGGVPGFVRFALMRGQTAEGAETQVFLSHTTWQSREAFEAWTQSEAFTAAHRQGSLAGVLAEHPELSFYDSVIVEEA